MKTTIIREHGSGSVLRIEVSELCDSLDEKSRQDLIRHLVADDKLFAAVLECVADDSRFGHFFADDEDGLWSFGSRQILELREKLIPLMSTIARNAVHEALAQRNTAQEEARRMSEWAWKLYHAWPADLWCMRPGLPTYAHPPAVLESELPPKDQEVQGGK